MEDEVIRTNLKKERRHELARLIPFGEKIENRISHGIHNSVGLGALNGAGRLIQQSPSIAVFCGRHFVSSEAGQMVLSIRFEQAVAYTLIVHSGQLRKSTSIPYVSHLLAVAGLVLEHGGDEDEAIAALLHDAVEDAGGQPRLADIRQRFGERVAEIVLGCTDTDVHPKPPWRARKEAYIAHLKHVSPSANLVSCCDKLHNCRTIVSDLYVHGAEVWRKFNGGRDGTLWYYTTLVDVYRGHGVSKPLVDELERTVYAMQQLADKIA